MRQSPHSTKTLRQEQCLRYLGGAAGVIYMLNPEYQDLVPAASTSASVPAGPRRAEPWTFNASANGGGTAFSAHVGGFVFDVLVTALLARAGRDRETMLPSA